MGVVAPGEKKYMTHLKYKCKVNFVKLPLIWIYQCLKLIFENATAGRNTACRSVNRQATTNPPHRPSVEITAATKLAEYDPPAVTAVYTRVWTGIKKRLRNRPKSDTCLYELFSSQKPRKSPPAAMP